MKVLLLSHTCQSRNEGQPKATELARLGVELLVVVPRRWKEYGKWRSPETPLPGQPRFGFVPLGVALPWCGPIQSYAHFYPGLERVMRAFQPDIIDLWEEPWSLVSLQACRLRDRVCPGASLISETEQNLEKTLPPPFENFRSQVLRRADLVIGRSLEATEIVRRKGFDGTTRVVPNAVDAQRFRPLSPEEKERVRAELGWKPDEHICGYIGRIVEEKGLSDAVEALALCSPRTKLVLVGNGPFEEALRGQIARLGLEKRIEMLPARAQDQLAPLMGALDVLVLPSRTTARWKEQFGRVIIEAQACGVPVVGSDSGAIPDVVADAGLIFAEGDAAALAAHLDFLASNPEKAQQMGGRGREIVEQKYTWARVAEAMAAIYTQLHAQGRTPAPRPPSA